MSTIDIEIMDNDDTEYSKSSSEGEWFKLQNGQIKALVERLVETEDVHYSLNSPVNGKAELVAITATGHLLRKILFNGCGGGHTFPSILVDPHLRAFHEASSRYYNDFNPAIDTAHVEYACLNRVVERIKEACGPASMIANKKRLSRSTKKRYKSAVSLVERLKAKYARINYLRVDLSYREGKFIESDDLIGDLQRVKMDWQKLRTDLSGGIPIEGLLGFVARLEYGVLKGFHFHALFAFNGSINREDITLAAMIGEHWTRSVVPDGEGRYWNCNGKKDKYPYIGIGILNYYDDEKYLTLLGPVLKYMVKPDHLMADLVPGERTFFQSKKTQNRADRRGRPRRKQGSSLVRDHEGR